MQVRNLSQRYLSQLCEIQNRILVPFTLTYWEILIHMKKIPGQCARFHNVHP